MAAITLPDHIVKMRVSFTEVDDTPTTEAAACTVLKSDDEQRYMLTVAYPANKADTGRAADGFRDFAPPDVVEKAAWAFVRKGAKLGMWHQDGNDHCATTVESYIYRGPDWALKASDGTEQVIKAGDWLLGMILEPDTWALYKAGKIGGVSPQGSAKRRVPTAQALSELRS